VTAVLDYFKLTGDLTGDQAEFTLTATARIESPKGGSLELLSGNIALTEIGPHPKWDLNAESNRFILIFDRGGKYPIQLKFSAAVREREGWKSVDFRVAPSALQPIVLQGLPADTRFDFPGAARPERRDNIFASFLPPDGSVQLSWKQAPSETEGKLFYSAEMLSQINVRPGLMGQTALLNFRVMQGELKRVTLLLKGAGEITRVQGDQVLAWSVEQASGSTDRRLIVQFNQPQKEQFALQVQMQTPLGAFPQLAEAVRLVPEGATRFAGYFRIVNEGAVRLEVVQASGLSQISPEQFPESDATRAALRAEGEAAVAAAASTADLEEVRVRFLGRKAELPNLLQAMASAVEDCDPGRALDIALALARRPKLLMLDEPTSGVSADEKFAAMERVMEALEGEAATVLFVEHDMDIVSRFSQRVIAFYSGRVIADGAPAEVLADADVIRFVTGGTAK